MLVELLQIDLFQAANLIGLRMGCFLSALHGFCDCFSLWNLIKVLLFNYVNKFWIFNYVIDVTDNF